MSPQPAGGQRCCCTGTAVGREGAAPWRTNLPSSHPPCLPPPSPLLSEGSPAPALSTPWTVGREVGARPLPLSRQLCCSGHRAGLLGVELAPEPPPSQLSAVTVLTPPAHPLFLWVIAVRDKLGPISIRASVSRLPSCFLSDGKPGPAVLVLCN